MINIDIISPGGAFAPAAVGNGVTDDAPAFRAFNTWAQAQTDSITLTLGSGAKTFLFDTSDPNNTRANAFCYNIPQAVTVIGNGPTTSILKGGVSAGPNPSCGLMKAGNGNFGSTNKWTARLNSVSSGASTVTCKTAADTAQFSVNTWALITGLDMMGFGQPPNPFWFEYVYITDINAGTGVITFQSPLVNTYLDTWPVFYAGVAGGEPDCGGPATLYALHAWGLADVTFQALGIEGTGLLYPRGRNVSFINCKANTVQICPTLNETLTFTGCDMSTGAEFDKCVYHAIYDSTNAGNLAFQSSNNNVTVRNGSTVNLFNGTPRNLTLTDSTTNLIWMGTTGFGRTENFITSGSTIVDLAYTPVQDEGDDASGVSHSYSISNGTISMPKDTHQYGCRWAIPGTNCYFGTHNDDTVFSPQFQVISVAENGSNIDVVTNYGLSAFPSGKDAIRVMPFTYLDVAPNTVSTNAQVIKFKNRYSKKVRIRTR